MGGQGTVYAATALGSRKPLAIKALHRHLAEDPRHVAALAEEAAHARYIEHPHVCRVLDVGRAHGVPFLVMERLAGVSFGRLDALRRVDGEPGDAPSWRLAVASVLHDAASGLHAGAYCDVAGRDHARAAPPRREAFEPRGVRGR